ncbi:PAS domain S-box protein [Sporomusa sphaeroides DSM 2875]|uniref:PAS domain S-box protein n=1 Tax=Sporomusa sphaeroides TaxID=47679 RepID=UPI00202F73F2|nr:PAS domain S-box protein [Sporomusa sphaeroides DSM 2875]
MVLVLNCVDGELELIVLNSTNSSGSAIEWLTISRDNSGRKQHEQRIQEMETDYRQIFQGSPVVSIIIDPDTGNILDANQAAVDYYGYTLEELQVMTIRQINIAPRGEIDECINKVSRNHYKAIPFRHKLKDGNIREVEIYSGPVKLKGRILVHSLIIDVTARRRAEADLRESNRRLRDFAEAVSDVSFIIDEDGRYLDVFGDEKMLPMPGTEFLGKTIHQVLSEDSADFILNEVQQAIISGIQRKGIYEIQIGGEKQYFLGRTVPLTYIVNGKRTAAVIAADILEQQENTLQMIYELRRRSDIINSVLDGKVDSNKSFAYTCSSLGLDINLPAFVCKILNYSLDSGDSNSQLAKINCDRKRKDKMMIALSEIPNCIVWGCQDGIYVLCYATFGKHEWERSKEIASLIRTKLLEDDSSMSVFVGISEVHTGVEGLKKNCRQALSAVLAARSRAVDGGGVVHYREAGLFQFVSEPLSGNAAREYIAQHIGNLLEYDQTKQTNYLVTLEELLRGASIRETAEKQHLHPKSVIYRHKSIAKILNVDLNDYQTRLTLGLALQLYKLNANNL